MPPRRGRAARAAEPTETEVPENVDAAQTSAEDAVDGEPVENGVATRTSQNSVPSLKDAVPQTNGKPAPKSAAQKKREKRKQRKREESVAASETSDTESVLALRFERSLIE